MSRTHKHYPFRRVHRGMSGHAQAIRRKLTREEIDEGIPAERKKAIPPDPYEDYRYDDQCFMPTRAAENMKHQGLSQEKTIRRLKRKFRLSHAEAKDATSWIYRRGWMS